MFTFIHANSRKVSAFLLVIFITQAFYPATTWALTGGPSQAEFSSFQPAGMTELVDLFTGDMTYNIPLFEIGGYPINLAYQSGSGYEDESSWVGHGWTLNPGSINRNLRGVPDDFDGENVDITTNMLPNVTTSFSPTGGFLEVFGINLNVKLGYSLMYDNYKGIGFGPVASASFGPLTAGANMNSLTGINFNAGLQSGSKRNSDKTKNLSISGSYGSRSGLQSINIGTSYKGTVNRGKGVRKNNSTGGASYSFAPDYFSTGSNLEFLSESINITFSTGPSIPVTSTGAEFSGSVSVQHLKDRYKHEPSFGFLYMNQSDKEDKDSKLDFLQISDGIYTTDKLNLDYSMGAFDLFSVSSNGLSGQFNVQRRAFGSSREPRVNSYGGNIGLGFEAHNGTDTYMGIDISGGYNESVSKDWVVNNNAYNNFNITNNLLNQSEEEVYYQFMSDQIPTTDQFLNNISNENPITFALTGNDASVSLSQNMKKREYPVGGSTTPTSIPMNTNFGAAPTFKRGEARPKKLHTISTYTKKEATALVSPSLRSYKTVSPYKLVCDNPQNYTDIYRPGLNHHIHQYTITKPDGARFVYGLPVYNNEIKEKTFAVEKNFSSTTPNQVFPDIINYDHEDDTDKNKKGVDHFFQEIKTPAYSTAHLITSVLSSDYVDVKNDGITEDDLGSAVKFNYKKISTESGFQWRVPIGANTAKFQPGNLTDANDDKAHVTYGKKDIWYVHSIESNEHIAVFYTSNREDGLQVGEDGNTLQGSERLQKLDKIEIYSRQELNQNSNAKPIQVMHMKYAYKGSGVPNSTNGGKLFLTEVFTTYAHNDTKFQHYYFDYDLTAGLFSYDTDASDRWGTMSDLSSSSSLSRRDFPFANQKRGNPNLLAQSSYLTLNKITTPSGSIIDIVYENDDYAYVQNKRAGEMLVVKGFSSSSTANTFVADLYNENESVNQYVTLKLNNQLQIPLPSEPNYDVRKMFLEDIDNTLYCNFLCNMRHLSGSGRWERVEAYTTIDGNQEPVLKDTDGDGKYDAVTIKIDQISNDNDNYHPVSFVGFQKMRLNIPTLLYPTPKFLGAEEPTLEKIALSGVNFIKSVVLSLLTDVGNIFVGFAKNCVNKGFVRVVDPQRSYCRVASPTYNKMGGGIRVKSVAMRSQSFDNGVGALTKITRNYDYTTKLADGKGTIISSGVATWEPALGKQENLHNNVDPYTQDIKLAPDNQYYSTLPYCEALYPNPAVGYSKVTVKDMNSEDEYQGSTVNEFYTAKDCPTVVRNTAKETKPYNFFLPALFINVKMVNENVTQGYTVITNDVHGKPKSESVLDKNNDVVSSKKYYYKTKNNDGVIKGENLDNNVTTLTDQISAEDGIQYEQRSMGVNYQIWQDFKNARDLSTSGAIDFTVDFSNFPIYFFVFPPYYATYNETQFRSSTTLKHIHKSPILSKIEVMDKGATLSTENLLWDGETGNVLLTSVNNEYGDKTYSLNLPAYLAYPLMAGSYKNNGFMQKYMADGSNWAESSPVNDPEMISFAANPMLKPGDEVLLFVNIDNTDFDDPIDVYTLVEMNSFLYLMDNKGDLVNDEILALRNKELYIKVLRSGYRNMMSAPIYQLEFKGLNPISGLIGTLKLNSIAQLLQAKAVEYGQEWQTSSEFEEICTPGFSYNGNNINMASVLTFLCTLPDNSPVWSTNSTITIDGQQFPWLANIGNTQNLGGSITSYQAKLGDCTLTLSGGPFYLNSMSYNTDNALLYCGSNSGGTSGTSGTSGTGGQSLMIPCSVNFLSDCTNCVTECVPNSDRKVNPYSQGVLGNWRPTNSWVSNAVRSSSDPNGVGTAIMNDGVFSLSNHFWNAGNDILTRNFNNWTLAESVTKVDQRGHQVEAWDALNIPSSQKYGYSHTTRHL